jgi:hypothetical protein
MWRGRPVRRGLEKAIPCQPFKQSSWMNYPFRIFQILSFLALFQLEALAQWKAWSDGPLEYTDFPLLEDPPVDFGAYTVSDILLEFSWDPLSNILEVHAHAAFNQQDSWVAYDDGEQGYPIEVGLLWHEQGHFDFTEIYARKFKKRISESDELKELLRDACGVSNSSIESLLNQYHAETKQDLQDAQVLYEEETDHGLAWPQQDYQDTIIPQLLSGLSSFASPVVTVESGEPEPAPGTYNGTLKYTLQLGPNALPPFGEWNWTLQGQWTFSFDDDGNGGDANFSHQYNGNQVGGLLLQATTPTISNIPNVPVSVEAGPSGNHYWLDFSGPLGLLPSHELTFAPPELPLPVSPGNSTAYFPNGAALALGHWMNHCGNPSMKMKAPLTFPEESIHYLFDDMGHGQFLHLEWTLTREPDPLGPDPGGSPGLGSEALVVAEITWDPNTGLVGIAWNSVAGAQYAIDASEDLSNWEELDGSIPGVNGTTLFVDEGAAPNVVLTCYRIRQLP